MISHNPVFPCSHTTQFTRDLIVISPYCEFSGIIIVISSGLSINSSAYNSFLVYLWRVNMSLKQGRICPICFKENLYYLGDHLRQVHQLSGSEKKDWFRQAKFCSLTPQESPSEMMYRETCPYHDIKFHHTFRMMVVGLTLSNKCWPNLVSNTLRGSRKRLFGFTVSGSLGTRC